MALIVPTITAENSHIYREQIERVESFTERIHIDLMDGIFTPNKSVAPETVWWPDKLTADIHLMFQDPMSAVKELVKLKPGLVVIPAESNFDVDELSNVLKPSGIRLGIALLAETGIESIEGMIQHFQHLLIFSGNLGHQGGSFANLDLLEKADKAKALNPKLEIAWDGGINEANVRALAAAGVDILNVGGYVQAAPDAGLAFKTLTKLLP